MKVESEFDFIFELFLLLVLIRFVIESILKGHWKLEDIGVSDNLVHEWEISVFCENFLKLLFCSFFFGVTSDQVTTTSWVDSILQINGDLAFWKLYVCVDCLSLCNFIRVIW